MTRSKSDVYVITTQNNTAFVTSTLQKKIWKFDRHFFKNERNEPVTSRTTSDSVSTIEFSGEKCSMGKFVSATQSWSASQNVKDF